MSERGDTADAAGAWFSDVVGVDVLGAAASGRVEVPAASGRVEAAGALEEASAVPGYWMVFEGAVSVEFDLSDGTGFDDERTGFRGLAGAGWVIERGGLPEDITLWDLPAGRTR